MAAQSAQPSPTTKIIQEIASCLAIPPGEKSFASQRTQLQHRLNLNEVWEKSIGSLRGKRVLEVGCGQGDHTAALAWAVGEEGSVVGIDPGAPDYGSPFTLAQAQSHLLSSPLGSRITFHNTDCPTYINSLSAPSTTPPPDFTHAILSHCPYYFPNPTSLYSTLSSLRTSNIPSLLLAEWSLSISSTSSLPHLLAVLTQTMGAPEDANIRTALSSKALRELAEKAGWNLVREEIVRVPDGMQDGVWEVYAAEAQGFGTGDGGEGGKRKIAWEAHRDALRASVDAVGGKKNVQCMDVWCAVFE